MTSTVRLTLASTNDRKPVEVHIHTPEEAPVNTTTETPANAPKTAKAKHAKKVADKKTTTKKATPRKKASKPETVVAETTQVVEAPKPVTKPDPLAGLRNVFNRTATSGVMEMVSLGSSALKDEGTAEGFIDVVEAAFGVISLADEDLKRKDWYGLSFKAWETMVRKLFEEGMNALGPTVTALDGSREFMTRKAGTKEVTVDILEPLWPRWVEVAGPTAEVNSYPELVNLLKGLLNKGYVVNLEDRLPYIVRGDNGPDKQATQELSIVTKAGPRKKLNWLPALGRNYEPVSIMRGSWSSIKEAEKRAKLWETGRSGRMAELENSETKGLTFAKAKAGTMKGSKWFETGPSSGALVQVNQRGMKISHVVGIRVQGRFEWMDFSAKVEDWPAGAEKIARAFNAWMKVSETKPAAAKPADKKPKKVSGKKAKKSE